MSFAASEGRHRWIFDSIAVYADDHAVAVHVAEAVKRHAGQAERMGVFELENGNRIAWVRFEDRYAGPPNLQDRGAL